MIGKETMNKIKEDVENYIGEEVMIKLNAGRNRVITQKGVVDSVYSNTFLVKDVEGPYNFSYSYADVIMNSLQITKVASGEQIMKYEAPPTNKYARL